MKSDFCFKSIRKTAVLMLAAAIVLVFALAAGCNLKKDDPEPTTAPESQQTEPQTQKTQGNPVVISSPNLDYTLYDFRQAYYSNQYYMYMMYGMISDQEYFDMVVEDASTFMYVYNAAVSEGVELNEEELADFNERFDSQIEGVISQYANDVEEEITDEAERRAAAIELLNKDLAEDGLDYDTFLSLARSNMLMYAVADKYYDRISNEVEITDAEVTAYISDRLGEASDMTMASFKEAYEAYSSGQGYFPVYVPDDCFSVDHILLQFETEADGSGGIIYKTESTAEKEAELEAKLAGAADFEAFMELEVEYGEDPGMDEEGFRENGYLIHGDFDNMYYTGFVYAAMNLKNGSWTPSPNPDTGETYDLPELKYFTLKDGTKVVKVNTEPGVHYIIINKTYTKGAVEYEKGDAHWMSWTEGAKAKKFEEQYDTLRAEWEEKFPLTVHTEVFINEFVATAGQSAEDTADPDKK